jgi:hypothetical protein
MEMDIPERNMHANDLQCGAVSLRKMHRQRQRMIGEGRTVQRDLY